MPTAGSGQRRKMIRNKLAQYAGSTPDAHAIAAATVAIWPQISAQLAPVIGARGVDVLLDRSLHLTSVSFPWLTSGAEHGRTLVLGDIKTCLGRQEAAAAAAASCELVSAFCELLATLIGDSLTDRLLGPVWALPMAAPRQESGS
jgi:hypothetical protein